MFMMILTIFFSDFLRTTGLASTDIKYFKNWFFNLKNQLVGKNGVLDYYIWHNKDVAQLIYTGFVNRCVHMERDSVSVFRHIAAFFKKYKGWKRGTLYLKINIRGGCQRSLELLGAVFHSRICCLLSTK